MSTIASEYALKNHTATDLLSGGTEVDETYNVGGKRGVGRGYKDNKVPVVHSSNTVFDSASSIRSFARKPQNCCVVSSQQKSKLHTDEYIV